MSSCTAYWLFHHGHPAARLSAVRPTVVRRLDMQWKSSHDLILLSLIGGVLRLIDFIPVRRQSRLTSAAVVIDMQVWQVRAVCDCEPWCAPLIGCRIAYRVADWLVSEMTCGYWLMTVDNLCYLLTCWWRVRRDVIIPHPLLTGVIFWPPFVW